MTSGLTEVASAAGTTGYRTTEGPCPVCVFASSLDDDEPKLGTVRWELRRRGRLTTGVAVDFHCRNGHTSDDDRGLLKAFPSRLF
jgi:hypothetical protein